MKKIYLKQLLTVLLLLCSTVVSAATYSGTCGTSVNWSLDTKTGVLNITGTGAMTNYNPTNFPWYNYRGHITSVTIGNGVTSIGYQAFRVCTNLTSITIPNSVTTIGNSAFYCCSGLTSITIPNSVTSIRKSAFYGCSGLTSIEIPNSVTTIEESAFYYCSGLTSITIPNSVTSIGESAFYGCSGLTSVTIGNGVTSIGNCAFNDCSGLTSIKVESGNTNYDSRDNCNAIIETATNTLIAGCKNSIIPNSVTSIGKSAFHGCGLTSIEIPNSVTSIGDYAFSYCRGLTSVTIGNGVTSIGYQAFSYCSDLTSVTIGNSVTSIGGSAFHWTRITEIYSLAETPATIDYNTFDDYSVTLYVPIVPIGTKVAYQTARYWNRFTNIVEMDFTGIEDIEADGGNAIHGAKDAYYDLNGRRVENPIKGGIYIINGKKVVL